MRRETVSIDRPNGNGAKGAHVRLGVQSDVLNAGSLIHIELAITDRRTSKETTLVMDEKLQVTMRMWDWIQYLALKYDRLWPDVRISKAESADDQFLWIFRPRRKAIAIEVRDFSISGIYPNYKLPGFYIMGDSLTDAPEDQSTNPPTQITSWAYLMRDDGRINPNTQINAQGGRAIFDWPVPNVLPNDDMQYGILHMSSNDALYLAFGGSLSKQEHQDNIMAIFDQFTSNGFQGMYKVLPPFNLSEPWNEKIALVREWEIELLGNAVWDVPTSDYIDDVHMGQQGQADHADVMYGRMQVRVPELDTGATIKPDDVETQVQFQRALKTKRAA